MSMRSKTLSFVSLLSDRIRRTSDKSCHSGSDVCVHLHDLLDGVGLEEGGGETLFNGQYNSIDALNSDGCGSQLNGLYRILDLKYSR